MHLSGRRGGRGLVQRILESLERFSLNTRNSREIKDSFSTGDDGSLSAETTASQNLHNRDP